MKLQHVLVATALILFGSSAWADYSVMDNGEVLKPGHFKATGNTQVMTENAGVNVGGRVDMGLTDDYGVRGLLGAGKSGVFLGGLFKWMPIPDTETQPAIGGNIGLLYLKDDDISDLIFRLEPLVSKRLPVENVVFTPYASVPVGLRMRKSDGDDDGDKDLTLQLVLGTQLQIPTWQKLQFIAEVGIDLDKAPGYLNVGAIFYWDSETGMVLE